MSFRQKLSTYFNNHAETNDNHLDPTLKTNYYKTTKDKGLRVLENIFSDKEKYELNSLSKERGEISVLLKKGRKAFIVATVITLRPFETAIDFSVTTESGLAFDLGYSTKVIHRLYERINEELTRIE